jgi:hypothetical protein
MKYNIHLFFFDESLVTVVIEHLILSKSYGAICSPSKELMTSVFSLESATTLIALHFVSDIK